MIILIQKSEVDEITNKSIAEIIKEHVCNKLSIDAYAAPSFEISFKSNGDCEITLAETVKKEEGFTPRKAPEEPIKRAPVKAKVETRSAEPEEEPSVPEKAIEEDEEETPAKAVAVKKERPTLEGNPMFKKPTEEASPDKKESSEVEESAEKAEGKPGLFAALKAKKNG